MRVFQCQPGRQRLLPEWLPTEQVLLTWPRASGSWGDDLAAVEACFANLVTALLNITEVTVVAENDELAARLKAKFPQVTISVAANNDIWIRDYGPLTVATNQQRILIDAEFNGWGGKYPATLDNAVTAALHKNGVFGERLLQTCNIILEGGALEVDGNGTLITRSCCLPTRDSRKPLETLNTELAELFGLRQIAWLEHGELEGDDTDAHIDTLARFLPNNRLVYQACDDLSDSHFEALQKMATELAELRNADGLPYKLIALPLPQAANNDNGKRLPLSYANFLICNHTILLPTYGVPQDKTAVAILKAAAPEFAVVPISCRPLVEQYGSLHCATLQIAAG